MMNRLKCTLTILTVVLFLTQSVFAASNAPKYIFLLIGDGMGPNQRTVADLYHQSKQVSRGVAEADVKKLEMETMPFAGNITTFAFYSKTTDSAAAGTALATGYKTNNGVLGLDASTKTSFETVAEYAKKSGMKVGILSSVPLNHATPAAFYAHQGKRGDYYEIATQMVCSEMDFFGASDILSADKGDKDLYELAKNNGFTVINNPPKPDEFKKVDGKLWIYDKNHASLPYNVENDKTSLTLADYTEICIKQIDNPDGFFVMIEGGKIDWACHGNDLVSSIKETIALNDSYKVVKDFYDNHKEETLIIVTADHETGGLNLKESKIDLKTFASLIDGQLGGDKKINALLKQIDKDKLDFDAALVKMANLFGLDNITEEERNAIYQAYTKGGKQEGDFNYGDNRKITLTLKRLLAARAGIKWASTSHTDVALPVTTIGPGAELFSGNLDNTCIARYIRDFISQSKD